MLPLSELKDEIITKTETRTTPVAAEEGHHGVGRDERRPGDDASIGMHVEVGEVGQDVDGDQRQRAEDDGAGEIALRVLHFAGGKGQVGPPVVGPQHADQREADAADRKAARPTVP